MPQSINVYFESTLEIEELAATFRESILSQRNGLTSLLRGRITFKRPLASDDPFDDLGEQPDYAVYADIPLGAAGKAACAVHLHITDRGDYRTGQLSARSGGLLNPGHRKYLNVALNAFTAADPQMQVKEE